MTPLHIETFNGGLARGVPSVGLIIELPLERRAAVLAQTSVNVFQLVADADTPILKQARAEFAKLK